MEDEGGIDRVLPMKFLMGMVTGSLLTIVGYFVLRTLPIGNDAVVVTFTEAEIQEKIGKDFPKTEKILDLIPLVIQEPQVKFLGDSNRVQLTVNAEAGIPIVGTDEAQGVFTASIRYEDEDQTLRISRLTVESFKAQTLPERFEEPVRLLMTAVARKYIDDHIVHTLKPEDYKEEMARLLLREIKVKDGRLEVILGL